MIHFTGIAGSGMRSLALLLNALGKKISGSDREFDHGHLTALKREFEVLNFTITPQDGSGVTANVEEVIVSTAVENSIPDIIKAKELGIPITHRADLMARLVNQGRGIAIAGTSGKTTITAMLARVLAGADYDPWVLCGGEPLVADGSSSPGYRVGGTDWWCYETDESDKSILKFRPYLGIISSLSKDHMSIQELVEVFTQFADSCTRLIVHSDVATRFLSSICERKNALLYGCDSDADITCSRWTEQQWGSTFTVEGVDYNLPIPGLHNIHNALAVIACSKLLAIDPLTVKAGLAGFHGIRRRFQLLGETNRIKVVDDFAHNPDKITASLAAARRYSSRIIAIFQPHGFGPLRLMRHDFVEAFCKGLTGKDLLFLAPVFFAGGTVIRDISSADIAEELRRHGLNAIAPDTRDAIGSAIVTESKPGDIVLVMGARDDTLTPFAKSILDQL